MEKNAGKLYMHTIALTDKIEDLMLSDGNEKMIDLLERASNLGNAATLYYDELSDEEIERIDAVLALSESAMNNSAPTADNSSLEQVIGSLETLMIEKKMLLGEKKTHSVA